MKHVVKPISYQIAMPLIIEHHYLHRKCHCSVAVGLFSANKICGVIIFGKPASYTLCEGLFGKAESKNIGEFSRLWVRTDEPRNTESWFISRALKFCPYDALVSFADIEQGHVGYVYQATNWIYTGISKRMKYFRVKGSTSTGGVAYRRRARMSKSRIIKEFGEQFVDTYYSSAKHRYIYIVNKKRKKELLAKLKYTALPYPKGI